MVQVNFTLDLEDLMDQRNWIGCKIYMTSYMASSGMDNVSWSIGYYIGPMKKGGSNKKLEVVAITCFVIGS